MEYHALVKNKYFKLEHTDLSTAILGLAVCVFDIMNKASICGKTVCVVVNQPFSAL